MRYILLAALLLIAPSVCLAGPNKITLRPPDNATIDLVPDSTGGFLITITAPPAEPAPKPPVAEPAAPAQPPAQPATESQPPAPRPITEWNSLASGQGETRVYGKLISPGGRTAVLIYAGNQNGNPRLVETVPVEDALAALARWRSRLGESSR